MATAPAPSPSGAAPHSQFVWPHPRPSATGTAAAPTPSGRLSPPLVAMVAVVGTAFLIVLYVRLLSRPLRRLLLRPLPPLPPSPDHHLLPFSFSSNHYHHSLSPYGLDDSSIKALPLALFSPSPTKQSQHHHHHHPSSSPRDCAVCLVEFERGDPLRTLPLCSHSFHSDCIDTWLRSHANCPLCRAPIFRSPTRLTTLRSSRIRPSFDDLLLLPPPPPPQEPSSAFDDNPRDFLLTRSYSFGFERTLRPAAETSFTPWRHHRVLLWSKRWPSPYLVGGSSSSSSYLRVGRGVFASSSRSYYRRSPFHQQRRRGSFLPMSESRAATRRTRSMTSPVGLFLGRGSSRERFGDPEALLSPERLDRRQPVDVLAGDREGAVRRAS